MPGAADLRELTHTALEYNPAGNRLTPTRVQNIFTIVDEIEGGNGANYGLRVQNEYPNPAVRAAENWEDYDYYDEANDVRGYVSKAMNWPVYYATYTEDISHWARILPDGDLAPGDTLDRTDISHQSWEWPAVIVKDGDKSSVSFGTFNTGAYSGQGNDVVIDGKRIGFLDNTYTNEYTKISERLASGVSHVDFYFTRDYDYSYVVQKAYSIDSGVNADDTADAPGAFKFLYTLTVEAADAIDLKVDSDSGPVEPVVPPAEITAADFDSPIGFTITLDILGKKGTVAAPFIGAEETLLSLSISTWNDLIRESKKGTFARIDATNVTGVDTGVIDWILQDVPVLPGAAEDPNNPGNNVIYNSYVNLPAAVKTEIEKGVAPTTAP
jgi:hypothetical protein